MKIVKVVNVTKGVVIAHQARIAASLAQRMQGLLGTKGLGPDQALILKPCTSVHTFFMRFPIDVVFVDKKMCVIKTIPKMPSFRLSPFIWASSIAIELPAGKIAQSNTCRGDILEFRY